MTRRVAGVLLGLVALVAAGTSVGADFSLELKDGTIEAKPPDEIVEPVKLPYRYDRSIGSFGLGTGYFDTPVDVAVNSKGRFYILDSGNQRVQYFNTRDFFDNRFGASGSRDGEFKDP